MSIEHNGAGRSFACEDGIRLPDSEVDSARPRDRQFGALTSAHPTRYIGFAVRHRKARFANPPSRLPFAGPAQRRLPAPAVSRPRRLPSRRPPSILAVPAIDFPPPSLVPAVSHPAVRYARYRPPATVCQRPSPPIRHVAYASKRNAAEAALGECTVCAGVASAYTTLASGGRLRQPRRRGERPKRPAPQPLVYASADAVSTAGEHTGVVLRGRRRCRGGASAGPPCSRIDQIPASSCRLDVEHGDDVKER